MRNLYINTPTVEDHIEVVRWALKNGMEWASGNNHNLFECLWSGSNSFILLVGNKILHEYGSNVFSIDNPITMYEFREKYRFKDFI